MAVWHDQLLLIGCVDQSLYALNCDNGEQVEFSVHTIHLGFPCRVLFRNGPSLRMVPYSRPRA